MRLAALAFAVLTLGAVEPPRAQAQSPSAFDGTWNGTGVLTQRRGTGTACGPETMNRRFTITGGRIAFPYDPRTGIDFSGPIGADGRFEIVSGPNRFSGQASGSTMTATFIGQVCERAFRFRRAAAN
jgi:hypothetical protein